jgi:hypothetical protein
MLTWKNLSVYLLILLNILLIGYICLPIPAPEVAPGSLMGRWVQSKNNESYFPVFSEMEFDKSDRAVIDGYGIDFSFTNTVYTYQFTENGILTLGGARLVGSWQVVWIDPDHIRLLSIPENTFWGEYERRRTPNWLVVCFGLFCDVFYMFRLIQVTTSPSAPVEQLSFWKRINFPNFLLDIPAIFIGLFLGSNLWFSTGMHQIHLPWDLVIRLLISGLFLGGAIYLKKLFAFRWIGSRSILQFVLGIAFFILIGLSVAGFVISLPNLFFFIVFGQYI